MLTKLIITNETVIHYSLLLCFVGVVTTVEYFSEMYVPHAVSFSGV
jgi:hypothetical protein